MNEIYEIEEDENGEDDWTLRTCNKCRFPSPFSYGYNSDECKTCEDIEPSIYTADNYVAFFYDAACGLDEDIIDDVEDDDSDDDQEGQIIITEDGEIIYVEEAKESTTVIIIVAIIIVLLILGGYLFYKFYFVPKQAQKRLAMANQAPVLGKRRKSASKQPE